MRDSPGVIHSPGLVTHTWYGALPKIHRLFSFSSLASGSQMSNPTVFQHTRQGLLAQVIGILAVWAVLFSKEAFCLPFNNSPRSAGFLVLLQCLSNRIVDAASGGF